MGKKYLFISLLVIFSFMYILTNSVISDTFDVGNDKINYEEEVDVTIPADEDIVNELPIDDEITLEDDLTTIEEPTLETLLYNQGVKVYDYLEVDEGLIAIGSKNNYPYFLKLEKMDSKYKLTDESYLYEASEGKFIDFKKIQYYFNGTIENGGKVSTINLFQSGDYFIPFYKKQINLNYSKNATLKPKYFVIHETNNTAVGADADAHYRYWNTNSTAQASTHFVVDNTQVYQMLELNQVAWHVGDNKGHSDITNLNSIGLEIAVNSDGNYEEARQIAINLTIKVMKELNMDISQLKRHYDASGKACPLRMIEEPQLWKDFVEQVRIGLES